MLQALTYQYYLEDYIPLDVVTRTQTEDISAVASTMKEIQNFLDV